MSLAQIKSDISSVYHSITLCKGNGNTTALLELVRSNKNVLFVVGNEHNRLDLIKEYSLDQRQIVSFSNLESKLLGTRNLIPIFDNHAISILLSMCFSKFNEIEGKLSTIKEQLNSIK